MVMDPSYSVSETDFNYSFFSGSKIPQNVKQETQCFPNFSFNILSLHEIKSNHILDIGFALQFDL